MVTKEVRPTQFLVRPAFRAALFAVLAALFIMAALMGAYILLDNGSANPKCRNGVAYQREVPVPTYDGGCIYFDTTPR